MSNGSPNSASAAAHRTIESGLAAQRIDPLISAIASERTLYIVQQLVTEYKSRNLTTERLWAAVGALAELQELPASNERKVAAMFRAQEREHGGK